MTAAVSPEPLRVVIVDDTADLRELLRFALTRGGMDVVAEAGDGLAGIEAVRTTNPDIVLLDLSMPVMDGLEALPRIREIAPLAKILVLSGFDADRMAERAMATGADGYLQKGASLGRILDSIRDIVEGRSTAPVPLTPPEPRPRRVRDLRPRPLVPAATEQPSWDPVALAPWGILEVGAEAPYRMQAANPAARLLLGTRAGEGEPLHEIAPGIATAIANTRLVGDVDFEATVQDRPVRVTLRHTQHSLVLYLQTTTDEVGRLRNAIATTAHEIRGPVTVLRAITETLLEEELEAEHRSRMMASVSRQTRLLDTITGDLLVVAQLQRGTLRIDLADVDPVDVIRSVIEDVARTTTLIEVSDPRPVRADVVRLHQMLGNLVTNAHKYGHPPVELRVRTSAAHDHLVCLDVIDHGPGVPTSFRSQLFDEFSRASGTAAPGTGLGLHVVQALAQAQGGAVSYDSGSRGSVFTISLPTAVR